MEESSSLLRSQCQEIEKSAGKSDLRLPGVTFMKVPEHLPSLCKINFHLAGHPWAVEVPVFPFALCRKVIRALLDSSGNLLETMKTAIAA